MSVLRICVCAFAVAVAYADDSLPSRSGEEAENGAPARAVSEENINEERPRPAPPFPSEVGLGEHWSGLDLDALRWELEEGDSKAAAARIRATADTSDDPRRPYHIVLDILSDDRFRPFSDQLRPAVEIIARAEARDSRGRKGGFAAEYLRARIIDEELGESEEAEAAYAALLEVDERTLRSRGEDAPDIEEIKDKSNARLRRLRGLDQ